MQAAASGQQTGRLSVIVPVHNGGEGLRRCLQGLAASSRPPDEVITVDDGSTDTSAADAAALGARVLTTPAGPCGPAHARNRGAEVAAGDVLVFIDADVVVLESNHDPDMLRSSGRPWLLIERIAGPAGPRARRQRGGSGSRKIAASEFE